MIKKLIASIMGCMMLLSITVVCAEDKRVLSNEEIVNIASGYVRYDISDGYVDFESFTKEHLGFFTGSHLEYANREQTVLSFITDSSYFSFEYKVENLKKGYIEVFKDGVLEKTVDISAGEDEGIFEFETGEGESRIDIYLPREGIKIRNLSVDDCAWVKAIENRTKAIFYGDSITYGTSLEKISETYVSVLSRIMNYEYVNYGIGGYTFNPEQVIGQDTFVPDVVFVAYGANDSGAKDISGVGKNVSELINNIRSEYPTQKIYVLTPIWTNDKRKTDNIAQVRSIINEICSKCENVQVIDGMTLLPADTKLFVDGLHPNKEGNLIMALNIARAIDETVYTDVTELGIYDKIAEKFSFTEYPAVIGNAASYAYCKDRVISLDGSMGVYTNGRFYAPSKLMNIIAGKEEGKEYNGSVPEFYVSVEMVADKSTASGWKCRIGVTNLLPDKEVGGKLTFKSPQSFSGNSPIDMGTISGRETFFCELECPSEKPLYVCDSFIVEIVTGENEVHLLEIPFYGFVKGAYADASVVIDGVLGQEEWDKAERISCADEACVRIIPDWQGENDLSAEFSAMWDEEYFYFSANVTDDVFCQNNSVNLMWKGDCIQLGIYNNSEKLLFTGNAGKAFEEIAIAFVEDKPVAYRFGSQGKTSAGIITEDDSFNLECIISEGKATYELKISWEKLFGEYYTPVINDCVGISVLINDDDGNGRRGWMEYASGIGVSKNVNQFAKMQFIAPEDLRVMYNGEKINFDVKPLELEDIVIVPIRAIFEKMGAEVIWNGKTETVAANLGDKKVSMKIDSDIIDVNGKQIKTAVPIKAFNERAFIPIYAIAEIYDYTVRLNQNEKTVVIEK